MSRYIDAEALKDDFDLLARSEWHQSISTTWGNAFAKSAEIVDDFPTADVQEVRHGKWLKPEPKGWVIYDENAYDQCSECGNVQFLGRHMGYCPSCGARMDKDE